MSINAVSNTQALPVIQAQAQTAATPSKATAADDAVHLSAKAQATVLHDQGTNVKQIAASFGVTTAVVDGYLGISTATSVGVGIPAGAPPAKAANSAATEPKTSSSATKS